MDKIGELKKDCNYLQAYYFWISGLVVGPGRRAPGHNRTQSDLRVYGHNPHPRAYGHTDKDVYVPHWGLHGAAAFDLAVTSGLRIGAVAGSAQDGSRAAADYEARKRSHHNTEATCTAEGLQFVPLVAEACAGGWAPAVTSTWKLLARAVAGRTGKFVSVLTERLQQTLALTLQRENARAVLRRAGDAIPPTVSLESL